MAKRRSKKTDEQPEEQQPAAPALVGRELSAAREAMELTVDEVGDALNLAPQTVAWLEADQYDKLPMPAFTQGYIRNYAKHVGLDPEAVLGRYYERVGKPEAPWESPTNARRGGYTDLAQSRPGTLITAVVAAVGLLVVTVLVVVWPEDGEQNADTPVVGGSMLPELPEQDPDLGPDAAPVGTAEAPLAGTRQPARPRDIPDSERIDPDDPIAHLPIAQTFPVGSRPSAVTTGSAPISYSESETYTPRGAERVTPDGDDLVFASFTQDCWLELKDLDGGLLFGGLGRAGESLELIGQGPFRILLGYAPGAALRYNGDAVLLDPYIRNNVASLVIGQ
ncbi:MAG: RodZ domain-containing protein [Pseudomonadota bacterium]